MGICALWVLCEILRNITLKKSKIQLSHGEWKKVNCSEMSIPVEAFHTSSASHNTDHQVNISQSMLLIKMLKKAKFVLHDGIGPGVLHGRDKNMQQIYF